MPRKIDTSHQGCRVVGTWLHVDGSPIHDRITIKPEHTGIYKSTVYNVETIVVKTNREGTFVVTLPPSTAVGVYTVRMGGETFEMNVPDIESASFVDLIRGGDG